ncbi:MAG: 4-hydroxy-tetrahydrodipicolinate reductase [Gammaproteobacteria bacterium]
MAIRVLVNGAFGKMGQEVVKALENNADFQLVGKTGREDDLASGIRTSKAQVVVDFTRPDAAYANTRIIIEAQAHPVIGTTGLSADQILELQTLCAKKKLGGIIAPNFSLGGILMMQLAQHVARYFTPVEIIELHHEKKKDAPSGTAIKTAEMIVQHRSTAFTVADTEMPSLARGAQHFGIPIHSVRLPGILAAQEVIFGSPGETLRISHNTLHREAFMPGVLLACKKVLELKQLVYGLEHLL